MIKIRPGRQFQYGLLLDVEGANLDEQDIPVTTTFNYPTAGVAVYNPATRIVTVQVVPTANPDDQVYGVVTATSNADADLDSGETRVISTQFQFEIVRAGVETHNMTAVFVEGSIEDIPAEEPAPAPESAPESGE